METTILGIIVVTISTVFAVAGMFIARRAVGWKNLMTFHEVSGNMLSVVGTLYAVLLGFVVVDAMNNVTEMRVTVEQEANALGNIYLAADGLQSDSRERLHGFCKKYVDIVVNQEWAAMEQGKGVEEAHVLTWKMWRLATHLNSTTQTDGSIKDRLLEELANLSDNRRTRLVTASHGVAPIMWVILLVGGVFTMVFTYFFGLEDTKAQAIMTALVAITLSLNIFLVYLYGYPFSGDINISPEAFEVTQKLFKEYDIKCEDAIPRNTEQPVEGQGK